jgi:hypothetical protein
LSLCDSAGTKPIRSATGARFATVGGRRVVDQDQLPVRPRLLPYRVDGVAQNVDGRIVDGRDDRERRASRRTTPFASRHDTESRSAADSLATWSRSTSSSSARSPQRAASASAPMAWSRLVNSRCRRSRMVASWAGLSGWEMRWCAAASAAQVSCTSTRSG